MGGPATTARARPGPNVPPVAEFILIDDPRTWPNDIATAVADVASRTPPCEFASDLQISEADEGVIQAALLDRPVRVFHCTRLLEHERHEIIEHGLLPATDELRAWKLHAAANAGHLHGESCCGL